jgi:hypothetical protein
MGIPDALNEAETVGARGRLVAHAIGGFDRFLADRVEVSGFAGADGRVGTGAARQDRRHGDQGGTAV